MFSDCHRGEYDRLKNHDEVYFIKYKGEPIFFRWKKKCLNHQIQEKQLGWRIAFLETQ